MAVQPDVFRASISRVPLPVTVVTSLDGDGVPVGFTASSVCSLSVSPPSLLVCVDHATRSCGALRDCKEFAVDYLSTRNREIARLFATKGANKFDSSQVNTGDDGWPRIVGSLLHLRCSVEHRFDSFDHLVVIGSVQLIAEEDGDPLFVAEREFIAPGQIRTRASGGKRPGIA